MTIGNDPVGQKIILDLLAVISGYTQKIDNLAVAGLLGVPDSVGYIISENEKHFHNCEVWVGSGGVEDSLTPYQLASGNNDFGAAVQLLAPGDTPFIGSNVKFDPHRVIPVGIDTASLYLVRLIWDDVSVAAGEAARQYTTFPVFPTGVGSNIGGTITDVMASRALCGVDYLWAKCKNVTNLATIDLIFGLHEYIG